MVCPNVSRETMERLKLFEAMLKKWAPALNLVSSSNIGSLWVRHIEDSMQVYPLAEAIEAGSAEKVAKWVDMGSGAGFPGLVLAIMAQDMHPNAPQITLIESNQRKCVFLKAVLRNTGCAATVLCNRVEKVPAQNADLVLARALAGLPRLLDLAKRHLVRGGACLFPKGANWKKEVEAARELHSFALKPHASTTNPDGVILEIKNIR
ncbi:MAG: 16S rRNA (guanine(527)-N(7))-methyltransferase RsmG [Rhodobacteraceae bacterium]|nr:16S rRNA (guanine(527)-N(7))-methyltransferase RsmG [Paracoccaceae bacterium]